MVFLEAHRQPSPSVTDREKENKGMLYPVIPTTQSYRSYLNSPTFNDVSRQSPTEGAKALSSTGSKAPVLFSKCSAFARPRAHHFRSIAKLAVPKPTLARSRSSGSLSSVYNPHNKSPSPLLALSPYDTPMRESSPQMHLHRHLLNHHHMMRRAKTGEDGSRLPRNSDDDDDCSDNSLWSEPLRGNSDKRISPKRKMNDADRDEDAVMKSCKKLKNGKKSNSKKDKAPARKKRAYTKRRKKIKEEDEMDVDEEESEDEDAVEQMQTAEDTDEDTDDGDSDSDALTDDDDEHYQDDHPNRTRFKTKVKKYSKKRKWAKVMRWRRKKASLSYGRRVVYTCRKRFADSRKRVGGRFIKLTPEERKVQDALKKKNQKLERARRAMLKAQKLKAIKDEASVLENYYQQEVEMKTETSKTKTAKTKKKSKKASVAASLSLMSSRKQPSSTAPTPSAIPQTHSNQSSNHNYTPHQNHHTSYHSSAANAAFRALALERVKNGASNSKTKVNTSASSARTHTPTQRYKPNTLDLADLAQILSKCHNLSSTR